MYLIIILTILIGSYILETIVETLNASSARPRIPDEFQDYYDASKYGQSQHYLKDNTYFKIANSTTITALTALFILSGGFNLLDRFSRGFNLPEIATGLIFAGIIFLAFQIIELPFSIYHTFVIEEKYGFNLTRPKTFITDTLKSWILTALISAIAFAAIIWFFTRAGSLAWCWCWLTVTFFELFVLFIAPAVIMPLFNKFVPLADGELKTSLERYAREHNFKMKGVFQMDGSRRSTKSNAFFTGFGKYRRIVLFDTLIQKHSVDEMVSVLAHEMGHYKKQHYLKHIVVSILSKGVMFFILSRFIKNPELFAAFKMENLSVYASLLFFGFLYAPINMALSILAHVISRKHEYEADFYAVSTYKKPEAFISALKKLTVDNLSNLTPHPLKVFLQYTHPPVLKRIEAIRKIS